MGPSAVIDTWSTSGWVELRRQLGQAESKLGLGLARVSHLEGDPSRRRRGVAEFRGEK